MIIDDITVLILSYNESPNLARTLRQLHWAKRIMLIDSFSTDDTLDIARSFPQVEIFQREFDDHTSQWNYGLNRVETEWVLSLDADYVLTDELIQEIGQLSSDAGIDGYFAQFKYCVFGKPLRGTILPPRQVLFKKSKGIYINDGHTQLLQINGRSASLKAFIHHDDRKPLSRWLWAQDRYMKIEVKKLMETPDPALSLGDKIRKRKVWAPFIIVFYCLILKGGILDGWRGWYYAFQRMLAELLLSLRLFEYKSSSAEEFVQPNPPTSVSHKVN